jgi:hypothetical protein
MAKKPKKRLLAGVAFMCLWAAIAASIGQELPSGGGPVPALRRGANGQIEIAPPDRVSRPETGKLRGPPASAAPNSSPQKVGPEIRHSSTSPRPPGPPQPVITVKPSAPRVPDTAPGGAVVATFSVSMNDNSPFAGNVRFGAPYYDNNGKFALSGNKIVVNPEGPGIGPNTTTIIARITLEAIPEPRSAQ